MKRNHFLLLLAFVLIAGKSNAQAPCYTNEMRQRLINEHPELLRAEADYEKQIQAAVRKIDFNRAAKTTTVDQTGNENFWYDIPIVVHIVHDYGPEFISDDSIFSYVKNWNVVYAKQNADTADVVTPFKPYIGNPHIRLHLATIDPHGNPTHGITRHRSYLTYGAGEMAKYDDWEPTSYVNIWFINQMSAANHNAAAYAHMPADVTYIPYYDGIIALYNYANTDKTINHEMGHCFNLMHPWGATNQPGVECGDDGVDDTPPTKGHVEPGCQYGLPSNNPNSTYDSACATNYFKIYPNAEGGDSLANYPDTTNAQNIMDYTYCSKMFTKQQCTRMHAALNSTVAGRRNLWDSTNLVMTGALAPRPDLPPVPDFNVVNTGSTGYLVKNANFAFPGKSITFYNRTMGDTLTSLNWTFDHGASIAASTSTTYVANSFSQPGWVNVQMAATGNGTGTVTTSFPNTVFIADVNATNATNYRQQFDPSGDRAKWPMFNYFNNEFKWQLADVGMYDHTSVMYTGFDSRIDPMWGLAPTIANPKGDYDDMFSVPIDFTDFSDACNLNFYYSGACRSANSNSITDTLLIDYSANKSSSWVNLATMSKGSLVNKGVQMTAYTPGGPGDWAPMTIALPAAARTSYTVFRFRYKPGTDNPGSTSDHYQSTGNNFYIDDIHFSRLPAEASNLHLGNTDVAVIPNPTKGDAFVIIKDVENATANVIVTDITGKAVYTISQQVINHAAQVMIPHSVIATPGMYLVQVHTGAQSSTQKLVVY